MKAAYRGSRMRLDTCALLLFKERNSSWLRVFVVNQYPAAVKERVPPGLGSNGYISLLSKTVFCHHEVTKARRLSGVPAGFTSLANPTPHQPDDAALLKERCRAVILLPAAMV